jgi:hypothetical protein
MLPVLMPLRDGHDVPGAVMRGLLEQSTPLSLVPVSRPGQTNRRAGESLSRNVLLGVLARIHSDVAVMMDRDVVLTDAHAVKEAVHALRGRPELKVVHIRVKPNLTDRHFDMACIVFKREVASRVLFDVTRDGCCCVTLTEHLRDCGWRQEYLSDAVHGREHTIGG